MNNVQTMLNQENSARGEDDRPLHLHTHMIHKQQAEEGLQFFISLPPVS